MPFNRFFGALDIYSNVIKSYGGFDDFIDKLNRAYTFVFIAFLGSTLSIVQYSGSAIDCWCPGHFTTSHVNYANSICWTNGTFYVPFEDDIPKTDNHKRRVLNYYQWVPILLFLRAFLVLLPGIFWMTVSRMLCFDIESVIGNLKNDHLTTSKSDSHSPLFHDEIPFRVSNPLREITCLIDNYFRKSYKVKEYCTRSSKCSLKNKSSCLSSPFKNCSFVKCFYLIFFNPFKDSLSILYLTTKCMYTIVTLLQFVSLNFFLGRFYSNIWKHPFEDIIFHPNNFNPIFDLKINQSYFPKVTTCNFHIRQQVIQILSFF